MRPFRTLEVWRKSYELSLAVYNATRRFPGDELYGLTSQLRRASVSVGANIAEGCGRDTPRDMARFLQIAMGSASELEHELLLARDLNYLSPEQHKQLEERTIEVKRMLAAYLVRIRQSGPRRVASDL